MDLQVSSVWTRYPENPILVPQPGTFYARAIYNPSVVRAQGEYVMLFRGEAGDGIRGYIGWARSEDGVHFTPYPEPVIVPGAEYDRLGCEDPWVVNVDGQYVCTYVGNTGRYGESHLCLAFSEDLFTWRKYGVVLSPQPGRWNSGQIKAGAIAPFRVGGRFAMFFLGETHPWHAAIGIAYSDDLLHWEEPAENVVLAPRPGYFDSMGVEPGPPPLLTDDGIFLLYNGWDENKVHCVGAALLDPEDPRRVLARSRVPLLRPEISWERRGHVPDVVFATGLVYDPQDGQFSYRLYYGAADRVVGLALR